MILWEYTRPRVFKRAPRSPEVWRAARQIAPGAGALPRKKFARTWKMCF